MLTLIGYEWRKHFRKGSLIAALLLFTVLNVGKIYSVHESNSLLENPGWGRCIQSSFTTSAERLPMRRSGG